MQGPGLRLGGNITAGDGSCGISRVHTGTASDLSFYTQGSSPCTRREQEQRTPSAAKKKASSACACAGFNKMTALYLLQFHAAIIPLKSMLKMATVPTVSPAICGVWFCFLDLLKSFDKVVKSLFLHTQRLLKITHLL